MSLAAADGQGGDADWKGDRIASAERGENPTVLTRMRSGWAVIGDTQFLPGYCLLLAAPRVASLVDLDLRARGEFLLDMSILGDAIAEVCRPERINYSILGNTDPFLHAHVFPRYAWEPPERRSQPPWLYPRALWSDPTHVLSPERHGQLHVDLGACLRRLMGRAGRDP